MRHSPESATAVCDAPAVARASTRATFADVLAFVTAPVLVVTYYAAITLLRLTGRGRV
jgi:hypothetical protein